MVLDRFEGDCLLCVGGVGITLRGERALRGENRGGGVRDLVCVLPSALESEASVSIFSSIFVSGLFVSGILAGFTAPRFGIF